VNNEVNNRYLILGFQGGWEPRWSRIPDGIEAAVRHTLDERWGIPAPWGACDSGVDLESQGTHVLRAWAQVELGVRDSTSTDDVPAAGLLRTIWDTLEIFGRPSISGVRAIVPLVCAGEQLLRRVVSSILPRRGTGTPRQRVLIQLDRAWPTNPPILWQSSSILESMTSLTNAEVVTSEDTRTPNAVSAFPTPFASVDARTFGIEAGLPAWTVDDAGWLVEAVSLACHRAGIAADMQIALTPKTNPSA